MTAINIVSVALPVPLYQHFDYLVPDEDGLNAAPVGARVRVRFGARKLIGLIVAHADTSPHPVNKLKHIDEVLDEQAVLDRTVLNLLFWAADYYQQPIGEVLFTALPSVLRKGKFITPETRSVYQLSTAQDLDGPLKRAPRQKRIAALLKQHASGMHADELEAMIPGWHCAMKALLTKGFVKKVTQEARVESKVKSAPSEITLNPEQQNAYEAIQRQLRCFQCFLLDGVTGSGKTEVYLALAKHVLSEARQILFIVPEISLTPQLIERIERRLEEKVELMHSGLSDKQRAQTWLTSKIGKANIVVGTRSAVFLPFLKLGMIVIDEEHDLALKQQEGFLYNARDIAVYRAKQLNIPIILGTATPSFETQLNVQRGRYQRVALTKRAQDARPPEIRLIDMRAKIAADGLSNELIAAIRKELDHGNKVLLFLNRRGYAPTMMCKKCAWMAMCTRCDARMTFYKTQAILKCHHCLKEQDAPGDCPVCGAQNLLWLGEGTQKIEVKLGELFPTASITRIDRDSTRKRGALQEKLAAIHAGEYQIIIGTQMLSKGHDFPDVTLVGILNADQGLFNTDFRATERLAQLLVQVTGRAGRSKKKGQVILQTYLPEHPLLKCLLLQGYAAFSQQALDLREQCGFPPYTFMLMIRARANQLDTTQKFLQEIKEMIASHKLQGLTLYGPIPAQMERKAGLYQSQLILFAQQRKTLRTHVSQWVKKIADQPAARRVRWSIEVDPLEMN